MSPAVPAAADHVAASSGVERPRYRLYRIVTRLIGVAVLPLAFLVAPHRAPRVACRWALAARFPAEDLTGLTRATRAAVEAARSVALWRDGVLIGVTDGYRDEQTQARLFAEMVRRTGFADHVLVTVRQPEIRTDTTAQVVIAGHAFMQNLLRGHYELAVDAPPASRVAAAFAELARAT
jgi:hypothetical protein